ncbi:hypothetical protein ATCC90586_010831 [Pythium insidiosum]|nr:hypothetical protein ATCC90586_010513 [Pythium insidiosum]KAJ0388771.1 hypothetical protein ATCC90586_010831 [Pythium insidiosum]
MLVPDGLPSTLEALNAVPLVTKYLRSYHYAIGSMSTVTYGDISPRNVAETVAQIVIIVLCIIFYGYITGALRGSLERNYGHRIALEQRMIQIRFFGLNHKLSSSKVLSPH